MSKYAEIIDLLEKANGPNYALEVEIFKAIHPEYAGYIQGRGGLIHRQDGEDVRVLSKVRAPNCTASLDAATAIVDIMLPGWHYTIASSNTIVGDGRSPWADVASDRYVSCMDGPDDECSDSIGATMAIALLTAMFKALENLEVAV